jgi:hypothetical protein
MKKLLLVPLMLAMAAGLVLAGDGHDHKQGDGHEHAHDHDPKHGGVVVHSGHHHLELVASGASIELFVTNEEGGTEDIAAATASATVLAGGKTELVKLTPAGANSLKGLRNSSEGEIAAVVVSLTMPGHEPEQVRFKLD